jgi:hypothetical protein
MPVHLSEVTDDQRGGGYFTLFNPAGPSYMARTVLSFVFASIADAHTAHGHMAAIMALGDVTVPG